MSVFKQFTTNDVTIIPFQLNKKFTLNGNSELSNVGIERLTPLLTDEHFLSIKHLYYSNYLSSSLGDNVNQPILIPGTNEDGNQLIGSYNNPNRENYPQTSLLFPRLFPEITHNRILIISIPSKIFGEYIKPKSFKFESVVPPPPPTIISFPPKGTYTLEDDGEGNILFSSTRHNISKELVGNIFYSHGIVTMLKTSLSNNIFQLILNMFRNNNLTTCYFESTLTTYETQYNITLRENEFNTSLNPTLQTGSNGELKSQYLNNEFTPYLTSIGLYDNNQNLLAIAKLSQPIKVDSTTDMNIHLNLDI